MLVATAASFFDAPYPTELQLQHLPTAAALVGLAVVARKKWLGHTAFFGLLAFLGLHILGARWIYSYVPYDDWSETLFGQSLSAHFDWRRNHYDRLVHFASGVLFTPALVESAVRCGRAAHGLALLFAVCGVMCIGALYEVLEWQIAVWLAPHVAEAYNGQQGDPWDAQKDLALAFLGTVLTAGCLLLVERRRLRRAS